MIEVIYNGRLGNQMFQYALGRIFAEELKFQLSAEPLPFPSTLNEVVGTAHLNSNSFYYKNQECDFDIILKSKPQKKIILDGYFQRSRYYVPFWDRIKTWYNFPMDRLKEIYGTLENVNEQDILLYIRLSDYYSVYKWALTAQFYHTVLEIANFRNVYIVTEDETHPFLESFQKYNPVYLISDGLSQMFCGSIFNKIVMSNSTFAWWGAMLSNATEIYFPVDEDGIWCNSHKVKTNSVTDVDLRIDDPRITYFYNCPTVASFRNSPGLVSLTEKIPEASNFHVNSKAYCFL